MDHSHNILLIAKTFHPPLATGTTAFTKGLLQSILATSEAEITLLSTARPRHYVSKIIPKDVLKSYEDEFKGLLHAVNRVIYLEERKKSNVVNKIAILRKAKELTRQERFDFIHEAYDLHPLEMVSLFSTNNVPLVIKHVITPTTCIRGLIFRLPYRLLRSKSYLAFSSEFIARTYGMNLSRPSDHAFIIPPAIDTNVYKPIHVDSPGSNHEYEILYIGPVTPDRFPPQIIKALSLLNSQLSSGIYLKVITAPWRCKMELKYINYLRNLVSKLNLTKNVGFASKTLTLEEKLTLLNECDVFIQIFKGVPKSIVPTDPPITLLEAMACGKPVVANKGLSISKLIINGRNGYLVNDFSEERIAKTLHEAIMGGRKVTLSTRETVVKNFSVTRVSSILKSIYCTLSYSS